MTTTDGREKNADGENELFASVYPLDLPQELDKRFDYSIPRGANVQRGNFVSVPFGTRRMIALVYSVHGTPETDRDKIRPIHAVCSRTLSLSDEQLGVFDFLRSQTLCSASEAVRAMIPPYALTSLEEYFVPTGEPADAINGKRREIYDYVCARGKASSASVARKFGGGTQKDVSYLVRGGYLARKLEEKDPTVKKAVYLTSSDANEVAKALRGVMRSEGQKKLLVALAEKDLTLGEARSLGVSSQQISALEKKGLIRREERKCERADNGAKSGETVRAERAAVVLNDEQQAAYDSLAATFDTGEAHAALLEGVTGSGKTSVMLALIDLVLSRGKSVILLLPEIALTPQTTAIFCSRYGDEVAMVHSSMPPRTRRETYLRIRSGNARLVIGTRSAVFAPAPSLGLIVIDEEQEHTYKSDSAPRYHARDVARFRCAKNGALLLLASATPSLESRKKAEDGVYSLLRLKERYGGAVLPRVTVADMRGEARGGNVSPIGKVLAEKLRATLARGEQAVLFLNRRGYNNYVSCLSCGEAVRCPSCSVSLTYHTGRRGGEMVCHWCGKRLPVPTACPSCRSEHLIKLGYGTQRVEEELAALLPGARILRMDADSVSDREAYADLLGRFRDREADVLLGTQMVTKGHDFPGVTLVGVLLADASLYYDDYRASERTFAMLTQVIGRAGRRGGESEAVIQTVNPDNEIIALAGAQDYEEFFAREIKLRRALTFPPFCDVAVVGVTSANETELVSAAQSLSAVMHSLKSSDEYRDLPMIFFGPFEAPVYRVDGKYRMRMTVKCRLTSAARRFFFDVRQKYRESNSPAISIDFNPTNI